MFGKTSIAGFLSVVACRLPLAFAQSEVRPNGLIDAPAGEWRTIDPGGDGEWFAYEQHPAGGTILVAGNMSCNLLRSTDGAQTFHPFLPKGDCLQIFKLLPHPETPDLWYALGRISKRETGIFRSTDDGETWTCVVDLVKSPSIQPNIHSFGCVIAGQSQDTVIVRLRDTMHIWRSGLPSVEPFHEGLSQRPPQIYEGDSTSLMCRAGGNLTPEVFTAWGDGLYRRKLSGNSWQKVPGIPAMECAAVACDRISNSVYASFKPRGIVRLDLETNQVEILTDKISAGYLRTHRKKPGSVWAFVRGPGVFRSDDSGKTWSQLTRWTRCWNDHYSFNYDFEFWPSWGPFPYFDIHHENPDILYTGDDMRSVDGGKSWQNSSRYCRESDSWRGNGLTLLTDYKVWFDAYHPNRMYLGFSDTGLMMSEDRGNSVKRVRCYGRRTVSDIDDCFNKYGVYTTGSCLAFAVDPQRPSTWYYAASGKGASLDSLHGVSGMILKTTDEGRNWSPIVPWESGLPNGIISDLLVLPHRGYEERKLYAAVNYVTLNNGDPLPQTKNFQSRDLPELRPETGVFLSEDSGRSWKRIAGNDTFRNAMPLMDIACAPSDPAILYVAGTAGVGKRPANSLRFPRGNGQYGGVFRSSDAGESWTSVSGPEMGHCVEAAVHPSNPDIVFAACYNGVVKLADGKSQPTQGGVYRTTDGGRTWQCVLPVSEYVVEDGGNSWNGNGVTSVAINPELPNVVVASMNLAGVFRTVDGGDTWQRVDWERFQRYQRNYHSISINPHDPSELCLGLFGCAFVAYRDPVVIQQLEELAAREPNLLKNGGFEIRGSDGWPAYWEIGNEAMMDGREVLSMRESPSGKGMSLCAAYDADKAEVRADGQRIEAWADCRMSPFMLSRARGKKVKVSMDAWLEAGGHDGLRPALLLVETRDGREYVIMEVTASVAYGASGEPSSSPSQQRKEWVKYESYAQVSENVDSLRAHIWACSKGKGLFYFDNVRIELAE